VFKPGFLVLGLLGYRHTVTPERDPTIVAHRYDLLIMSKLQARGETPGNHASCTAPPWKGGRFENTTTRKCYV